MIMAFGSGPTHENDQQEKLSRVIARASPQMIMTFGSGPTHENDQQEHDMGFHGIHGASMAMPIMKKRFRTKFTQEQKDKMCSFAEKGAGINLE